MPEMSLALQTSSSERRDSARSRLFVVVRATDCPHPMWAWDLSLSGMQCRTLRPRWPGTYMDLRFRLPDIGETLHVGSQVMTLEDAPEGGLSLALRFCNLSSKSQRLIYRFLDSRRGLWDGTWTNGLPINAKLKDVVDEIPPRIPAEARAEARPFEVLLIDAYRTLQRKALRAHTPPALLPSVCMLMAA